MKQKSYAIVPYLIKDVPTNSNEVAIKHKIDKTTDNLRDKVQKEFGQDASILSHSLCRHDTMLLLSLLVEYVDTQRLQATVQSGKE